MLSGIDLAFIKEELKELVGARVRKIFQSDKKFFFIFYSKNIGKKTIKLVPGGYACITKASYEKEKQPPSFCMLLRKYIKNLILVDLEQKDFERIISFKFKGEKNFILIVEFFDKGNLILCDDKKKIIAALKPRKYKDRSILSGEFYRYPREKMISFESEVEIVKEIANSFGKKYAEEMCYSLGIDKKKKCNELSDDEKKRILEKIDFFKKCVQERRITPQIIIDKDNLVDVIPFDFSLYKARESLKFDSFSDAVDYFYSKIESSEKEIEEKKEEERRNRIIKEQEEKLSSLILEIDRLRKSANLMIKNIGLIEDVLKEINEKKSKGYSFDEIEKQIKSKYFKRIIPEKKEVVFDIDNSEIKIKLNERPGKIASSLFEKAKKMESKIEHIKKIIGVVKEKKEIKIKEKEYWYEKFSWFFTSNNLLVIAGRNAIQNENLIRKYMQKNDIVFHAEIKGSPFALLREGLNKAREEDKLEAAKFVACFSKAWKYALPSVDVYYVFPTQLTKKTEAGEFIKKGSFVIKGKKNYIKDVELKIAVCFDAIKHKLFCAPVESAKARKLPFIVLIPKNKTKEEISKEIKEKLIKIVGREDLKDININRIISILPEGGFEIEDTAI